MLYFNKVTIDAGTNKVFGTLGTGDQQKGTIHRYTNITVSCVGAGTATITFDMDGTGLAYNGSQAQAANTIQSYFVPGCRNIKVAIADASSDVTMVIS